MKILLISLALFLSGCAQFGSKVVIGDETYSERAYAQKAISAAEQSKYDSVTACVQSCDVKLSDLSEMGEVAAVVAQAAGKQMDFCGCAALAQTSTSGRNYFDAKTETAISRHQAVSGGIKSVAGVVTGAIIANAVVDTASTIATNSGDRYNVDIAQDNRTSNVGGEALSNDASVAGAASETPFVEGEEFAENAATAGSGTASGGSGGAINADQSAMRNNVINIGGNSAIAGERAAAGQQALVNGESSLQSLVTDSEFKQSPVGEEITEVDNSNDAEAENSNSGFDDGDGGNGVVDF